MASSSMAAERRSHVWEAMNHLDKELGRLDEVLAEHRARLETVMIELDGQKGDRLIQPQPPYVKLASEIEDRAVTLAGLVDRLNAMTKGIEL